MEVISAWLIYHKATLDKLSPINFDGSTHMYGVGVVPATNMKEALELFDRFLADQKMSVVEVSKCEQYEPSNFAEHTEENDEIREVVEDSLENESVGYACAISSEAYEMMEENKDD